MLKFRPRSEFKDFGAQHSGKNCLNSNPRSEFKDFGAQHSGKKNLNITWPGQARAASYFGPNVTISGQMFLFRAKCPYFIEKYLKFRPRSEFKESQIFWPPLQPSKLENGQVSIDFTMPKLLLWPCNLN